LGAGAGVEPTCVAYETTGQPLPHPAEKENTMSAFEDHYSVQQLAKMWGVSRMTVTRRLRKYAHLIPDINRKSRSRFGPIKRPHTMWRIPKSIAERIYRDFIGDAVA
jgi:hypothetical protein